MSVHGSQPPTTNESIAAFQDQIRELRRDLKDTLTLIEKLRENCLNIEAKLTVTEKDYDALLKATN